MVSSLPFFDHAALSSLRYDYPKSEVPKEPKIFPLRLLIAPNCTNTTSRALDTALSCWPNLVFLDLSDTPAARDPAVLAGLRNLLSLQVVKLRHIDLRDQDLEILADAITTRARSLDIRDNKLTDASIRKLLSTCFNSQGVGADVPGASRAHRRSFEGVTEEDWPLGVQRPADTLLDEFKGEDLDQRFIKRLTNGSVARLPSDDLPPPGLTHLYLAKNLFTIEGIASLLRTKALHVLDLGKINTTKTLGRTGTRLSLTRPQENYVALPGVEKLAPVLARYGAANLTYLRVHHELVTKAVPSTSLPAELPPESPPVAPELETIEAPIYELGNTAPAYEMGDENPTPRYELPGDPIHMFVSPAVNEAPRETVEDEAYSQVRRGSAFAPEAVSASQSADKALGNSLGLAVDEVIQAENTLKLSMALQENGFSEDKPSLQSEPDPNLDAVMVRIQDELRQSAIKDGRGLLPGTLPLLKTLVLTNVPCTSDEPRLSDALKAFVSDCASERRLANMRAQFERGTLHLPGKGRRKSHSGQHFALQQITLEMASSQEATNIAPSSPRTPTSSKFPTIRDWSSTEDPDTQAFWAAAENDFSFFGDEECGLPDIEPGMHFPRSTLAEKMPVPANSTPARPRPPLPPSAKPVVRFDTIQEVAAFRRERKVAYELAARRGEDFVEGHWPGEIKVVKHFKGQKEFVNDYGSLFEKW